MLDGNLVNHVASQAVFKSNANGVAVFVHLERPYNASISLQRLRTPGIVQSDDNLFSNFQWSCYQQTRAGFGQIERHSSQIARHVVRLPLVAANPDVGMHGTAEKASSYFLFVNQSVHGNPSRFAQRRGRHPANTMPGIASVSVVPEDESDCGFAIGQDQSRPAPLQRFIYALQG
jgi:hypothetical protein